VNGFDGEVGVVTGGGSGLGEAIAKALAIKGVKVVISDINLKEAFGGEYARRLRADDTAWAANLMTRVL
jgi:NAD(P)-dependent dehydrogenase (short-subunit alcohol dehydrogenase family)